LTFSARPTTWCTGAGAASCHLLYNTFLMNLDMRKTSKILSVYAHIEYNHGSTSVMDEPKILYEGVILTWEVYIAPDLRKQTNKRTPYISTYINKLLVQNDVLMAGLHAMR
jgi:hypothetical protein